MIKKLNYPLIAIMILAAILFFYQLGTPSVWDNDEGQLLGSAVEMVKSGEFLTPHLNGEIYFHKPPLMAWLTALAFSVFGFSELTGRIWFAFFGLAGIYLTYLFGKKLYGERAGLLSALILVSSSLYIILARMALVDIALTFFITLSLYCFYSGYKEPDKKGWFYGLYASMALGTLTKGPLGIVVPGSAIFLFLLFERRLDFILKMRPILGAGLYLLIAAPWFVIETIREGVYFLQMIFGLYLFGIYTAPLQQHPGPIYYYLIVILFAMLPWSGLLPVALFKKPSNLLLWLLGIMLFIFSTAATKVPGYFLPAFPALSIICAKYLDEVLRGQGKKGFYFGMVFAVLILIIMSVTAGMVKIPPEYISAVAQFRLLLYIILSGLILALILSFFRPLYSILIWSASIFIFFAVLITTFLPLAEDFKYTKDFAGLIETKQIGYYQTWLPPSFVYYLNAKSYPTITKMLADRSALYKLMFSKEKAYCLTTEEEAKKLPFPVLRKKAGYALIGNRR